MELYPPMCSPGFANESLDFSSSSHSADLLASMHSLLVERLYCDVVFLLDDGSRVSAHKIVLGAASPYFKALFNNEMIGRELRGGIEGRGSPVEETGTSMKECCCDGNGSNEIQLRLVSADIFGLILDFVYTGNITLDSDNVQVRTGCMWFGMDTSCMECVQSFMCKTTSEFRAQICYQNLQE